MKKVLVFYLFIISTVYSVAQIVPPYSTNFETNNPQWTHYPEYGSIDDWQWGSGSNNYAIPNSGYFAWCTNVNNNHTSGRYSLETPSFDLSDMSVTYVLSFYHKRDFSTGTYGKVYYSIDGGNSWSILNISDNSKKYGWYSSSSTGFTGTSAYYVRSRISLEEIQGNSDVRFKFYFFGNGNSYGWTIDDFEIKLLYDPDIVAQNSGILSDIPSNLPSFPVYFDYDINAEFGAFYSKNYIYYSLDNVLDGSDLLIDSMDNTLNMSSYSISYDVINTGFVRAGNNYIFISYDVDNNIIESDEFNNSSYYIIDADSVYDVPHVDDFESNNPDIIEYNPSTYWNCDLPWERGLGNTQILHKAHSGENAWSIYLVDDQNYHCYRTLEMPYTCLQGSDNIIQFFYKTNHNPYIQLERQSYYNGSSFWADFGNIFLNNDKGWDYFTYDIPVSWDSIFKFRIQIEQGAWNYGMSIDDYYVGTQRPDLLFDGYEETRYTTTNIATDTLFYHLLNCGSLDATSTKTNFYLSADSAFDAGDTYLGQINEASITSNTREKRYFTYVKPNQNIGEYFIIALLDADSVLTEMREYNNLKIFKVFQRELLNAPYSCDFESNIEGWYHFSDYNTDPWFCGYTENGHPGIMNKAFCVHTDSISPANTRSQLYTPVYNLNAMTNPVLQFDLSYTNLTYESQLNMDYSTDGGATWRSLDSTNMSFKRWYYKYDYHNQGGGDILSTNGSNRSYLYEFEDKYFPPNNFYMGREDDGTNNCIIDLDFLKDNKHVQFRFNYGVDRYSNNDIVYIDNFRIIEANVDLTIDYVKNYYISPLSQDIEFEYHLKNTGNYINDSTLLNLYFSVDSLLDGSDYLVDGDILIPPIQPDQRKWFSELLDTLGSNLIGKNYVIFEIDPANIIQETDETNNICFYRLNPSGIASYPYIEDFDDYEYHGWRNYNYWTYHYYYHGYRFTNKVYRDHPVHNAIDGVMKLDNVNGITYYPTNYLESPRFDLSGMDSVFVSFNFEMSATNTYTFQGGANLEYSLDAGQNWNLLGTYNDPIGINWYNIDECGELDDDPAWGDCDDYTLTAIYDATSILANLNDVTFRFRTKNTNGCWEFTSFKMDNFRIGESAPEMDFVSIHHGDSLDITLQANNTAQIDTIQFSLLNAGDLFGSSNVVFRWSDDTIYGGTGLLAGEALFYNAEPNDTITFNCAIEYPYNTCDSVIYLTYNINAQQYQTGSYYYQVNETDYTNNQGYFCVNLHNHHWLYPARELNYINDTTLCDGDQIVLKPAENANYPLHYSSLNWSNGSTEDSIIVTTSGIYFVDLETQFGCTDTTDSINIQFLYNNVDIHINGTTAFCSGDSVELYILDSGNPLWMTGQTDSSIYAYGGVHYSVMLESPDGCIAYDTISLQHEFPLQPYLDNSGDVNHCGTSLVLSAGEMYDNYLWNTGDTLEMISIDQSGAYYFNVQNSCGVYNSDTINVTLYNLIDSIIPGNLIAACEFDTVSIEVFPNSGLTVDWYNCPNSNIYSPYNEDFNYSSGSISSIISQVPWWIDSSATTIEPAEIIISSGNLIVLPHGDSIIFHTDLIDISDYFNIELSVDIRNTLSDSMYVYYRLDGGPRKRFEIDGAIANNNGTSAEDGFFEGDNLEIIVVFNGYTNVSYYNQAIHEIEVKGRNKQYYSYNYFLSGNTYDYYLNYPDEFIVVVDNGICQQEEVVAIEISQFDTGSPDYWVCNGINDTLALTNLPINYEVVWPDLQFIIDTVGNSAVINTDSILNLTVEIINQDGCMDSLDINVTPVIVDTSILINNHTMTAVATTASYQWIDCYTGNPVNGEIYQNFTPSVDGSYAVEVDQYGCIDTSACYLMLNVSVLENSFGNTISLYPNPTYGQVNINLAGNSGETEVFVYDAGLRLLEYKNEENAENIIIDLRQHKAGIYFVDIRTGIKNARFKVIKTYN